MHIAILGGTGNAGRAIAHGLVSHTSCELTLLSRDVERARAAAHEIDPQGNAAVRAEAVDARDREALVRVLEGVDWLVVASSTTERAGDVASACVAAGTNYMDIQLSSHEKWEALARVAARPDAKGRCLITDGGIHPGLPGAMMRYAAGRWPGLREAHVGGVFGVDWAGLSFSPETVAEFVDELRGTEPKVLHQGQWVRGWKYGRRFDFGPPFGRQQCVPMWMREIEEAAVGTSSLEEAGFYVGGFGPIVDRVAMPLCMLAPKRWPGARRAAGRFFRWALNHFSRFDAGAVVVLEGEAAAGPIRVALRHSDAYVLTAAPVVACLLQVLRHGSRNGLWTQAGYVDPPALIDDLARMGVGVDVREPEEERLSHSIPAL